MLSLVLSLLTAYIWKQAHDLSTESFKKDWTKMSKFQNSLDLGPSGLGCHKDVQIWNHLPTRVYIC